MSFHKKSFPNKIQPLFINHRINTLKELNKIPLNMGIEADIRDYKDKLILSHDPFKSGEKFSNFLKKVNKRVTFLNIKSFGIIDEILEKIKNHNNFYFLDLCFSEIHYLIKKGYSKKIILRFSKYEKFDLKSKSLKNIEWIWFDYFDKKLLTKSIYNHVRKNKKKICIVSPDLLGGDKKEILKFIKYLKKNKFKIDAICTKKKFVNLWEKTYQL